MFARQGAQLGRRLFHQQARQATSNTSSSSSFSSSFSHSRRRFASQSALPLASRHPQPYSWGKVIFTAGAVVIGYCGFDRFVGQKIVDFEHKRILQRERQYELREIKSRDTHTIQAVSEHLQANAEPVDWESTLESLTESQSGPVKLLVSSSVAEAELEGHAGVISLEIDDTWTKDNVYSKVLEAVGYPVEEHLVEDFQDRFFTLIKRLAKRARAPSVLLVKDSQNDEVLAELQSAVHEPAFGGAYGVYLIKVDN